MDETVVGDYEPAEPPAGRPVRASAATVLLIGLAVGVVLGLILALITGWRPFSDANDVRYREITVGSVSPESDQICWPTEPDRRDTDQQCAILAIDPRLEVPQAGDVVTVGMVRLETPDGGEMQQVVWVSQPPAREDVQPTS